MRKRFFRIIMSLAILLLVILSGMLAYSYFNVERSVSLSYQKSGLKAAENESKEEVLKGKKPLVVLLMGTDTGALGRDYKGRTDSIMVLVLNPRTKKSIIDQLGGGDITPLLSFDYEGYSYKKGVTTHMNGDKALEYCRMRYDDPEGDYDRQKRQRQVLTARLLRVGLTSRAS